MKMSSFPLLLFFYMCSSVSAHQWEKFHRLAGCRQGDTNPAIPELKKYLHHLGYLPSEHHDPSKLTESFDEALHSALRTYQLNFNLEATGVLDPPTIGLLTTPRCGVPDIINGTNSMLSGKLFGGRLNYAFYPGRAKWSVKRWKQKYRKLTYLVDYETYNKSDIPRDTMRVVFTNAFRRWAEVTDFAFQEVDSLPADIAIGFDRVDGQLGVLAHATQPEHGIFVLDKAEDWEADRSKWTEKSIDLETVCVHEIGHLLGLDHSSVEAAVMWPIIITRTIKTKLSKDDIDGIKALYGFPLSATGAGDPMRHVAH